MVRTRFAPSPTGYLHIGGIRTALFAWAYARKHQGAFVLRIEDTDLERSTPESVQAILDGMAWVGLDWDEGPFYQTQRMARYQEVIAQLLQQGKAYPCYCSREELDALREQQMARGEKPRYDRRWRPEPGKTLPQPPEGVTPVVRFRTPLDGVVAWDDAVKGRIEISNEELDDLIIARGDGSPTYNFCVVVDDWDMQISHVIRGDDHVNNTPRQIHILQALGAPLPQYGHLPMILREDGQKMSKRRDPVSVTAYEGMGILPAGLLNYLARLGWSHGDDEYFDLAQFVAWFDLDSISPSPARFDPEKLRWVNQQHLKALPLDDLAARLAPFLSGAGVVPGASPSLTAVLELVRERASTLVDLAAEVGYFYQRPVLDAEAAAQHLDAAARERLAALAALLVDVPWELDALKGALKAVTQSFGVKAPLVMMPLRVALTGRAQSPSVDQVLLLLGRDEVLARLATVA